MGVTITNSTIDGGMTPICNSCGITLCWDISDEEYYQNKVFWESWICQDCNGGIKYGKKYHDKHAGKVTD